MSREPPGLMSELSRYHFAHDAASFNCSRSLISLSGSPPGQGAMQATGSSSTATVAVSGPTSQGFVGARQAVRIFGPRASAQPHGAAADSHVRVSSTLRQCSSMPRYRRRRSPRAACAFPPERGGCPQRLRHVSGQTPARWDVGTSMRRIVPLPGRLVRSIRPPRISTRS